jgi:hypothetical protein
MEHLLCRIDILEFTSQLNQPQVGICHAAMSYVHLVQSVQTQSSLARTILTMLQKIQLAPVCLLRIHYTWIPGRAIYRCECFSYYRVRFYITSVFIKSFFLFSFLPLPIINWFYEDWSGEVADMVSAPEFESWPRHISAAHPNSCIQKFIR